MEAGTYEKLNEAWMKWITSMRGNKIPVNAPILLEIACKFAHAFNYKDFQASNRCLRMWKERYAAHLLEHIWVSV